MQVDIFCRVVDNFGDIGVVWRLARQLKAEYNVEVKLVVDNLASFRKIEPRVDTAAASQIIASITILRWHENLQIAVATDCVIEAFACTLPPAYVTAMASRATTPVWINLEYLSAEPWVTSHHLLASPHPTFALTKYFFFSGFVEGTGGLLRERDLPAVAAQSSSNEELRVFLFSYKNAAEVALLTAMAASPDTRVSMPYSGAAISVAPHPIVSIKPFVAQADFDLELRRHDILFVRGEDSFVRAQWAEKPFVWQIYPQESGAHWVKLNAFLDLYCEGLQLAPALALRELWRAWNAADSAAIGPAWMAFVNHRQALTAHAENWAAKLRERLDLASNLMTFIEKTAKI